VTAELAPTVDRAHEQLRAALALLADDRCEPASARIHLITGWQLLDAIGAAGAGDATARIAATDDDALAGEVRALARAVRHATAGEPALTRRRRLRWAGRGAALVAVVAALVALLRPTSIPAGDGPWRAAYYLNRHFRGAPELARDRTIAFDWGDGPARFGYSRDWFAIRWDSCLVIAQPTALALRLAADDGARLWIDGDLVIDDWRLAGTTSTAEARIELAAGRHPIRIDYVEHRGAARIWLTASVNGGPMAPLADRLLQFPGWSGADCAAASSGASRSGSSDASK
jgi:hypothetical protein